jgi:HEAT repeat protein
MLELFLKNLSIAEPREDAYDISSFSSFNASEKIIAEDAIMQLASNGDAKALVTIGKLKLDRAEKILIEQAKNSNEWVRFSANRALLELNKSHKGILEDTMAPSSMTRFGAISEISRHKIKETNQVLIKALDDEDSLVRFEAYDGLLEYFDLVKYTTDENGNTQLESPLKTLGVLLVCDIKSLRFKAVIDAKEIFKKISEGNTPESLDLIYKSSGIPNFRIQIRDSFYNYTTPFSTDLIQQAQGHDRYWAEVFIALQLNSRNDFKRSLEALVNLNVFWIAETLKDFIILFGPSSDLFEPTANAIEALSNKN